MTQAQADGRVSREQPWPGLLPFDESAKDFFHGRGDESRELARLVRRETLTVLFGQSGLGKSSLLRAGVFPILRAEDHLPIYVRLQLGGGTQALGEQVFAALRAECTLHGVEAPAAGADESLWTYFKRPEADFWSARNRLLTPLLVFDQFEEVFTLGRTDGGVRQQCERFLAELADLVEHRTPARVSAAVDENPELATQLDPLRSTFRVVFCFREDFLAEFEGLRDSMPSIMRNRLRLTRMDILQAKTAILASGSHLVSEAVADQIIQFVSASRVGSRGSAAAARNEVEPALLSVVCRELNRRRLERGRPQISEDLLEGSAQQEIVRSFYDDAFEDLPAALRAFVEDQLLTEGGFRDSYAFDDALRLPGVLAADVERLIDRRLLRKEERAGVWRLELTHDLLTDVARDSRDRRQQQAEERARQQRDEARRRRTRRLVGVGVVTGAVAIGLIVTFASLLRQSNLERERLAQEQSRTLLARANLLFEQGIAGEPQDSLAQALDLNPSNLAAVARAVTFLHQRHFPIHLALLSYKPEGTKAPTDLRWQGDSTIAVHAGSTQELPVPPGLRLPPARLGPWPARLPGGAEVGWPERAPPIAHAGDLSLWVEAGGQLRTAGRPPNAGTQTLDLPGARGPVITSADGTRALLRVADGQIAVLAVERSRDVRLLHTIAAAQGSVLTGHAGKRLVALSGGTVSVYDLDTGRLHELMHPSPVNDLEVHEAGQMIATACQDQNARVWNLRDGRMLGRELRHEGSVLSVSFSPDGRQVISGSLDGTARAWQVATGQAATQPLLHAAEVTLARLSPSGQQAVTLSAGGELQFWQLSSALPTRVELQLPATLRAQRFHAPSGALAVALPGGQVGLWKLESTGGAMPHWRQKWLRSLARDVRVLAFSPNGQLLALALDQGGVQQVRADTGEAVGAELQHPSPAQALAYSVDAAWLATGAEDGTIRTYDATRAQIRGFVMTHADREAVAALRFSPDGRLLLSEARRPASAALWVWSMDSRRGQQVAEGPRITLGEFVDPGNVLVVVDKVIQLFSVAVGAESLAALRVQPNGTATKLPYDIWSAALSPNRRQLAVGGLNGVTQVLALDQSMVRVGDAMKGVGVVESVGFSQDGRWLVTRTANRAVQVWDAATGVVVADPLVAETRFEVASLDATAAHLVALDVQGRVLAFPVGLGLGLPAPDWLAARVRQSAEVLKASPGGAGQAAVVASRPAALPAEGDDGWAAMKQRLQQRLPLLREAHEAKAHP